MQQPFTTFRFWLYCRIEGLRKGFFKGHLQNFEKKTFSQNGEDGIIEEIFKRVGTESKLFVEIGINYGGDKVQGNTPLLLEKGWEGVWIDCTPSFKERALADFKDRPIRVQTEMVTRTNIAKVFQSLMIPKNFDLLSIDIDGNDYWVWEALSFYKPRVVIMEYSAAHGPFEEWIMPYDESHRWDGKSVSGASLKSFTKLGKKMGYSLVGCDSQGVNAFFVREDLKHFFTPAFQMLTFSYTSGKYNAPQLGWMK